MLVFCWALNGVFLKIAKICYLGNGQGRNGMRSAFIVSSFLCLVKEFYFYLCHDAFVLTFVRNYSLIFIMTYHWMFMTLIYTSTNDY